MDEYITDQEADLLEFIEEACHEMSCNSVISSEFIPFERNGDSFYLTVSRQED